MKRRSDTRVIVAAPILFPAAGAAVALIFRICRLLTEFQYDEWWTLLNFTPLSVTRILTDLSLPNNHPVNTLILKCLAPISTETTFLRMGVFLTGALLLFFAAKFAAAWRGKEAAAASLWLVGCAAPVVLYSVTARGYIYQLFGAFLCAGALYEINTQKRGKVFFPPEIRLVAGGILSFLSLPTGILWLALLGAGSLCFGKSAAWKTPGFRAAVAILLISGAFYYGINFDAILSQSRWGTPFPTFLSRLAYFGKTLLVCGLPCFAPWLAFAVYRDRKNIAVLLGSMVPLILFTCTCGGPERIYLPMLAVWAMLAASGFARAIALFPRRRRLIQSALLLTVAALTLPLGVWRMETPAADWRHAMENTPKGKHPLVVLRSSAGYPAILNDPRIAGQWQAMLTGSPDTLILVGGTPGTINGADADFSETELPLQVSPLSQKGAVRSFALVKRSWPEAGGSYLIVSSCPQRDAGLFSASGKMMTLNLFFPSPGKRLYFWQCGECPPNLSTAEMGFYQIVPGK